MPHAQRNCRTLTRALGILKLRGFARGSEVDPVFLRSPRSTSLHIAQPHPRLMRFAALTGIPRQIAKLMLCGRSPVRFAISSALSLETTMLIGATLYRPLNRFAGRLACPPLDVVARLQAHP